MACKARTKGFIILFSLFTAASLPAWQWGVQEKNWTKDPQFLKVLEGTEGEGESLSAALFFQINDLRALNALPPLVYKPSLEKASLQWSKQLSLKGSLDQDPDLSTRIPGNAGELLAYSANFPGLTLLQTALELAEVLYTNPATRVLLLHGNLQDAGVGVSFRMKDGFLETRAVLSFLWGGGAVNPPSQEKPRENPPKIVESPRDVSTKDIPSLNWGRPVTELRNPRFFGTWTGGREAYRIDFSLESLIGAERPLWILGITRPQSNDFSALFIKLSGKKAPGLLTRFRQNFGEPKETQFGTVEGDTEPARIFTWRGSASELKLFEGETHTYLKLAER